MSFLYDLLKEKASNVELNKEIVMIGRLHTNQIVNYFCATYEILLKHVNTYIEVFNNPEYTEQPIKGRRKYIIVDNSINSIAAILALLEVGSIPVIIDAKNIKGLKDEILPYLDYGDLAQNTEFEDELIEDYLNHMDDFEKPLIGENLECSKLIISSGGSESFMPHFNLIKEEDLIKLPIQYGEGDSIFYSYISCANISGLLTNLVNFLVHDAKLLLDQNFNLETVYFASDFNEFAKKNFTRKYTEKRYFLNTANLALVKLLFNKKHFVDGMFLDQMHIENDELVVKEMDEDYQYLSANYIFFDMIKNNKLIHPDTLMFPRNILSYLNNADLNGVDLSNIKKIYLSGGINSINVIKKVREKIPSIKENVFINLYGSTEANGVMCYCLESDLETCYIDISNYENKKISYTFDKINFYERQGKNIKKIDAPADLFSYMPYLTVSSKIEKNIDITDKLEIKYNNKITSDIGIYINNKLYVLGRKSDLIKLNGKTYITHTLESYLSNQISGEVYITTIDDVGIQPYIKENKICFNDKLVKKYAKLIEIAKNTKAFHINPPVVIDNYIFEESKISGKIHKPLLKLYENYASIQYNNVLNLNEGIKEMSKKIISDHLEVYANEVLEDGSFIADIRNRLSLPITDIFNNFYKPINVGIDKVKFIPKPEIIFMTSEHIGFNNTNAFIEYKGMMSEILYDGIYLYKTGELLPKNYKPLKEIKNPEELLNCLKYNIIYDVFIKYMLKKNEQDEKGKRL